MLLNYLQIPATSRYPHRYHPRPSRQDSLPGDGSHLLRALNSLSSLGSQSCGGKEKSERADQADCSA